ncbi:MAG TPA: hypothetical protein VGC42_27655 [Kofleriaceae bacterium]
MQRLLTIIVALGLVMCVGVAYGKGKKPSRHHDAHAMTKDKLKTDGTHEVHRNGKHTASAEVQGGKIKSFHVKHATKGEVAVKKVKSKTKVAMLDMVDAPIAADTLYAYDGYCYIDDDDVENCYWYPVEVVIDDFSGAVEYVAPV